MREYSGKLGSKNVKLAITWGASERIAEEVGDILVLVREAAREAIFAARGIDYKPEIILDTAAIAKVLYIGLSEAGSPMTEEALREAMMDAGLVESRELAESYISAIATPKSAAITNKDKPSGKK